jgi:superfamily II DNA or RNA helicase
MNFLVDEKDLKSDTQYIYIRHEGDGSLNIGKTFNGSSRYSSKTKPKSCHWIDVTDIIPNDKKDPPVDDIFNNYLRQNRWINVQGHRDLYKGFYYTPDNAIGMFDKFSQEKIGKKVHGEITLRPYQIAGAEFLINTIKNMSLKNPEQYLFEACTGFGKTMTLFYSLLQTRVKTTVIITNRILVANAFITDFVVAGMEQEGFCLITPHEKLGLPEEEAIYKIYCVASRTNSLISKLGNDILYVVDEAHLSGAHTKKGDKFYKNKNTIFITATGNKFTEKVDSSYYFGISDMAAAINQKLISPEKFPLPTFHFNDLFADWDFGNLRKYTKDQISQILDLIVKQNNGKNSIICCGGRCENGFILANTLKNLYPDIAVYCSTDGTRSKSFAKDEKMKNGRDAIKNFDVDCEREKNIIHILVTVFQGRESLSYYDLSNIHSLCDHITTETFCQLLGRLMREKKNSHSLEANFFMYNPFVEFCSFLEDQFKSECEKKSIPFNTAEFNNFVKVFKCFKNGQLASLSSEVVLETISVRGCLTRKMGNGTNNDWEVLQEVFEGERADKTTLNFGTKTEISKGPSGNKKGKNKDETENEDSDIEQELRTTRRNNLDLKKKFELVVNRLPFYFRYLEKKQGFYPSSREDLVSMPLTNFGKIVYNFTDGNNHIVHELWRRLSDDTIEIVLKKLAAERKTELRLLPYGCYNSVSGGSVNNGRFTDEELIQKFPLDFHNKPAIVFRTGIDYVLSCKNRTEVEYWTDIFAEKFLFEEYGIAVNFYIGNWVETVDKWEKKTMIIGNPPFKGCDKITKKAFEISDQVVVLTPPEWIQCPDKKRKENYKDLIDHCESFEQLSSDDFRNTFGGLRMELETCIIYFNKNCNNPVKFQNHSLKQPKFSLKDQVKNYEGEDFFLTLRTLGNAHESPISFGISKGKPFKLYESSQINENDTVLSAQNKRRAKAGKAPLTSYKGIIGIPCKSKKDVEGLRDYILSNQKLLERVHLSHKWQLQWIKAYGEANE